MILKSNGAKLVLLALTAFNVVLLYVIVRKSHFNHQGFKRISKTFIRNELYPIDIVEIPTMTITHPVVNSRSAFNLFGLADEQLMQKMDVKRPLFNFTLVPWKIIPGIEDKVYRPDKNWSMIAVVKSEWKNLERRKTVRDTWASLKNLLGVELRTVFIVGSASHVEGEIDLKKENQEFGDLLQINSSDVYDLVGMKTIAGMQWAVQNFPSHWIYTSADDDMFPNLIDIYKEMEDMMQEQLERRSKFSSSSLKYDKEILTRLPIHCGYSYRDRPRCLRSGKWTIEKEVYSLPIYPPYCHGGWYSMPVSLAQGIHKVSREHEFFKLDDVWFTSLLRLTYFHKLGIDQYFGVNASDHHIGIRSPPMEMAIHGRPVVLLRAWVNFRSRLEKMNVTDRIQY